MYKSPTKLRSGVAEGPPRLRRLAAPLGSTKALLVGCFQKSIADISNCMVLGFVRNKNYKKAPAWCFKANKSLPRRTSLHQPGLSAALILVELHGDVPDAALCLRDHHILERINAAASLFNFVGQELASLLDFGKF